MVAVWMCARQAPDDDAPNASGYLLALVRLYKRRYCPSISLVRLVPIVSAAFRGLKFMGCEDNIRNLLCTNAGSVRTVGVLFFRHILGTFASEWVIERRVARCCLYLRVHRYFEIMELQVADSLVCRLQQILWLRFNLNMT